MSSASDKTFIRARAIPAVLRISDWPLRDDPIRSALLIVLLLGMSWLVTVATGDTAAGLLALLLLGLTLRRLWIPTVYELSSKGIIQTRLGRKRRVPWSEIGRVDVHDAGFYLCHDPERHPISFLRGQFISWNGRREEILNVVDFYLQPQAPISHPTTRSLSQV